MCTRTTGYVGSEDNVGPPKGYQYARRVRSSRERFTMCMADACARVNVLIPPFKSCVNVEQYERRISNHAYGGVERHGWIVRTCIKLC